MTESDKKRLDYLNKFKGQKITECLFEVGDFIIKTEGGKEMRIRGAIDSNALQEDIETRMEHLHDYVAEYFEARAAGEKNFPKVRKWATLIDVEKAHRELADFKAKFPWAKLEATTAAAERLKKDLPNVWRIIQYQEARCQIMAKFIEVSKYLDATLVEAIQKRYNV